MAKSTILYIEDNPQNMRLVRKFLRMGGYTMLEAENGTNGITCAINELPAVILMDINLPDIDGVEVTRHLKAQQETAHIPIIALTANAMHGDRERFMEAGCDDYLSKPVSKNDLLDKVGRFMKQAEKSA
jgi:two-component system, cell cycle response regulator DivK